MSDCSDIRIPFAGSTHYGKKLGELPSSYLRYCVKHFHTWGALRQDIKDELVKRRRARRDEPAPTPINDFLSDVLRRWKTRALEDCQDDDYATEILQYYMRMLGDMLQGDHAGRGMKLVTQED